MKYSYKKTFWKGVKYLAIFIVPFLATSFVDSFPDTANLTIGALMVMASNWFKHKVMTK